MNGDGTYNISDATALINQSEEYNFAIDGRNLAVNFAIDRAAKRLNMNGPNVESHMIGFSRNPAYDSTYGDADIITESNRNYHFNAWGRLE